MYQIPPHNTMITKQQQMDITSLPVENLAQMKEQFGQEVEQLSGSLQQLMAVTQRIFMAGRAVETLATEKDGKDSLCIIRVVY